MVGADEGVRDSLELQRFSDVDAFTERVGEFLAAREAEHNLILGICSNLRSAPEAFDGPPYLAAVTNGREVLLAAVRTPPWNLVLSEVDDPAALDLLASDLAGSQLPGVLGPIPFSRWFAERWATHAGRAHRLEMSERIFRLTTVRPPRPVPGRLRPAAPGDREWLISGLTTFLQEASRETAVPEAGSMADRWLAGRDRTMYLWDDGGVAVSLCGVGSPTPNGLRIGPVYTPPAFRRRGYASACVAAASQAALDGGSGFCFLFTDLANPTSNHIYQEIGYEPVRDVEVHRFEEA